LLVGLLALALLAGADWPRFRGPGGTGISADKGVPVRWTADNVLWKAALPGAGHSSPIIWGERVFVQSSSGKDRLLLCLDATSGKVLWSRKAPALGGRTHDKNTLASSTPATDGTRVYAVYWDGRNVALHAYDFKGNPLWQHPLGTYIRTPPRGGKEGGNRHGCACSPIVYGDKVFVNLDTTGKATVIAVDASSGKRAWEAPRPAFRTCYSTPFVLQQGGKARLIVASTAGLSAYDPADGAEVWKYVWSFGGMPLRTVGSPVASDGLLFACSGDGSGDRSMIAVRLGGTGDVTKTNLAWEKTRRRETPYVPTVLATGGYVHCVNDDGLALCLSARDGAEVWRQRLTTASVSASPVLIDGKVYVIDERGEVYVYAASPAGYKRLGRSSVGEPVFATPAVAGGKLLGRGGGHLFCIGWAGM
jgi:outer membrane protein assembly factor BamB